MRTEVEFNQNTGIVTTRFFETLTIEEVKAAIGGIIRNKEYVPGMKGIYDLTHANLSDIDGEMVEELSIQIERLSKGRIGRPRVALVSENALNYGTVSLFREYYVDMVTELEVFESLIDAEKWLLKG
ncbi:MAG: hypothetical protein MJE63_18010 [Proteobacteria bacterium]|nr:hypothetical protein [Pseudomonadota bacterium]